MADITDAAFDAKLEEILSGMSALDLIGYVPSILDDVREYFNNEVIHEIENDTPDEQYECIACMWTTPQVDDKGRCPDCSADDAPVPCGECPRCLDTEDAREGCCAYTLENL